jgi:hypothetical protein
MMQGRLSPQKRKLLKLALRAVSRIFDVCLLADEDPKHFERTLVLIQEDGPSQRVYEWNL